MEKIGNVEDARIICEAVRKFKKTYCNGWGNCPVPKGWSFLGNGSYRSVWLSPGGVAYKVAHCQGNGDNYDEWRHYERIMKWCELPKGTRVPACTLYEVDDDEVIAVERVHGATLEEYQNELAYEIGYEAAEMATGEYHDLMQELEGVTKLRDVHTENVMIDENGVLVLVDLGQ